MQLDTPYILCIDQSKRNEVVNWLADHHGPLRRSSTSDRGTIWYAGPRWIVVLATGHGAYSIHYKAMIWDSELAVQFALLYGVNTYSGPSRIDDRDALEFFDETFDDHSVRARSLRRFL